LAPRVRPASGQARRRDGIPASGSLVLYEQNTAIAVPSTDAIHRVKQLTGNQMFVSRQTTSQRPPPKILPIYIS
jgi:hypothetical protein